MDPERIAFDPRLAQEIATRLLAGVRRTNQRDRRALEDVVDEAMIAAYGAWATGWRWVSDGGPVRAWIWQQHSLSAPDAVEGPGRALGDWRAWLEMLAATFAAIDDSTVGWELAARIEHAAVRLLPLVVERTDCEEAWYLGFTTVMSWYVERFGCMSPRVLDTLVRGRFASWCAPDAATAAVACAEMGKQLARELSTPLSTADALAAWQLVRAQLAWARFPLNGPVGPGSPHDGHVAYIETKDRPRDTGRADRMREALSRMRAAAQAGEPLTMALLAHCQRIVLGLDADPGFRTSDAYAKAGRERYAIGRNVAADFDRCLAEANRAGLSPLARAGRVYLDVCFFHPFEDGNARAARLALDHVLTSNAMNLSIADPVFALPLWADDEPASFSFMFRLERVAGSPAS